MVFHTGGQQAHQGPGGLRGGRRALAAKVRRLVAVGRFAPAAAGLLVGQQPIGPGHHGRIVGRHADGDQSDDRLPGAIDVVDAPAAEPTAVGVLLRRCRPRPDRPPVRRARRPR